MLFLYSSYLHTFHFHIRIICYSTIDPLLFTLAIVPVFYTPLFCNTTSVLHWTYMNLYVRILTIIFTSYAGEGAWLRKPFVQSPLLILA